MFMRQSGIWLILCQLMAILAKLLDMNFKFVLPNIYINFDIPTDFEVNQTQIGHCIPKNTPKILLKWPYLKTKFCPSVIQCKYGKSIFTLILRVLDKFIEKCRRSRLFGDRMANLGLIDFKIG